MAGGKCDERAHPSKGYDHPSNGDDRVHEEERDHINIEIPNRDEEQDLQFTSPNGNAGGQKEESVRFKTIKQRRLPFYRKYKKAIIAIFFSLLIFGSGFSLGTLVPLNRPKECPAAWIAHQGKCYKLSEEEKNWMESQNVCISHDASLAKITDEKEKAFVRKLAGRDVFWIGLKREPDQSWKWLDGENSTLNVTGNGGNCAFLNNDDTASSGTCDNKHRYICKKN